MFFFFSFCCLLEILFPWFLIPSTFFFFFYRTFAFLLFFYFYVSTTDDERTKFSRTVERDLEQREAFAGRPRMDAVIVYQSGQVLRFFSLLAFWVDFNRA